MRSYKDLYEIKSARPISWRRIDALPLGQPLDDPLQLTRPGVATRTIRLAPAALWERRIPS